MPGWARRLRIVIDWTFAPLLRPDIVKISLDSEAALLLRNAALGEASGVAAGSAVLPTPPLAGGSDPQAGREPLVPQQR